MFYKIKIINIRFYIQNDDMAAAIPVIRLDFGGGVLRQPAVLDATLWDQLREHYERFGATCRWSEIHLAFARLIEAAHRQTGERVVVLIDEIRQTDSG